MESGNLISKVKVEKNQLKSTTRYEIIKADYFLEKVFNNLKKGKTLNIVKYNENIKKRININTNDYKEYSEKYSSIEIEIKPVSNKYGEFIKIKEEEEIYYHIYFNNKEEEIKRNYINEGEEIKIIRIKIDYQVKSFKNLFFDCEYIESIYFKKFYRTNINNMNGMFSGCSSLKEISLSKFNNIKSKYILEKVFNNLKKGKTLNIVKYNENI